LVDPCLQHFHDAAGQVAVRLGIPVQAEYPSLVAGRWRPNTVLAVAYDLKVFFTALGNPPQQVSATDVLGYITAQRTGGRSRRAGSMVEPRPRELVGVLSDAGRCDRQGRCPASAHLEVNGAGRRCNRAWSTGPVMTMD